MFLNDHPATLTQEWFPPPSQSTEKQDQFLKYWSYWKQSEFCHLTMLQSLFFPCFKV